MKNIKFLAGILSLILITGLTSPAFADPEIVTSPSGPLTPSEIANMQTAHNIVFDNGGAPDSSAALVYSSVIGFGETQTVAEDFVINSDTLVTDFHFVSSGEPSAIVYTIYSDNGGLPGGVLVSGNAQNLMTNSLGVNQFEVWFDLEVPFLAEAGETYWFGIKSPDNVVLLGWILSNSGGFGADTAFAPDFNTPVWNSFTNNDSWFLLSGHSPAVGGELLPIDSTALILAGAQSYSWMIPVLLSGIGIGLFVVSRKN